MTHKLTLAEVLRRLRARYGDVVIDAGEREDGFWIRATQQQGRWSWERFHIVSIGGLYSFAQVMMSEFHGT